MDTTCIFTIEIASQLPREEDYKGDQRQTVIFIHVPTIYIITLIIDILPLVSRDRPYILMNTQFEQGNSTILLDEVHCTGSEENIFGCQHNEVGVHDCGHTEDVGVDCQPSKTFSLRLPRKNDMCFTYSFNNTDSLIILIK